MDGTLHITIPLAPRTKKNHSRIVQVKGRPIIIPSREHEVWFKAAVLVVRQQWSALWGVPVDYPCAVAATFYRDRATGDLVNYMGALADLLQAAGVVADDKWIFSWDQSRLAKDDAHPRIDMTISDFTEASACPR